MPSPRRLRRPATSLALAAAILLSPAFAQEPPVVMVPQAAPQPAAAPAGNGAGRHTLNLKAADINVLIQTVSEITGRSFIVDQGVAGVVTVISSQPMTSDEIYEVFLSVLRVNGYAAVAAGRMTKIVPDISAAQQGSLGAVDGGPDAVLTRLIELRHVSADEMAALLRPLLSQQAHVAAHGGSNSLLVADRAGNLERISAIIRRVDVAADAEIEVIPLRHASAAEIARTLIALEQSSTPATQAAPRVLADERTNSLLLSGDRAQRLRARSLVVHLDTPLDGGDSTQVVYLRNASAEALVPVLEGVAATLTGRAPGSDGARAATIQAHPETNALVISAQPAVFRELAAVVRQLDLRRAQVHVEAIIAELSDELISELGVQWQSTSVGEDGRGVIGGTNFPGAGGAGSIVGGILDPRAAVSGRGLNVGYLRGAIRLPGSEDTIFQLGALVKALRGDGRANVLSSPSIVTLDHQEAEIKVVQEVPFLTGQFTNTASNGGSSQPTNPFQTVERKDVGVILTVTPHVNEGDAVRLVLRQEVSALAPQASGAIDLITNKRELSTTVLVPDGGLLVLGGLTSEETTENVQGVPGVSRIPLFGKLFKSRSATRSKRHLVVFLRPTILRDAATEAAVSSEKYNYIRTEQLRVRERSESRIGGEHQPLLPELPVDLFRNPPPPQRQPESPRP